LWAKKCLVARQAGAVEGRALLELAKHVGELGGMAGRAG
jgi:hypothetical protein